MTVTELRVSKEGHATDRRDGRTGQPIRRRPGQPDRLGHGRGKIDAGVSPVWEDIAPQARHPAAARCSPVRDAVFRRALALADVLGAYLALLFAARVLAHGSIAFRPAVALIGPFVVVVSKAIGLYDRDQNTLRKNTLDELPSILYLALAYTLVTWMAEAVLLRG
jgi:hypothetical protein